MLLDKRTLLSGHNDVLCVWVIALDASRSIRRTILGMALLSWSGIGKRRVRPRLPIAITHGIHLAQ